MTHSFGAYTADNIVDGTVANADIASGAAIDASKIANGGVSSTEFQYLANVTSDIQTQIAAKVSTNSAAALTSVTLDGGTALANYVEGTFTPTVTLVGGAGNTVPVYSTNTGRYVRIGRRVFVDVFLSGDGGNEGAGTGQMNIALPITSSASSPDGYFPVGLSLNNTVALILVGAISSSVSTVQLNYYNLGASLSTFDGAAQNNATRYIHLNFSYEV